MIERKSEMDNTESSEIENRFESIKNVIDKLKSKNLSKAKADKKLPEHDRERVRLERKGKTFLDAFVKDKSGTHIDIYNIKSIKAIKRVNMDTKKALLLIKEIEDLMAAKNDKSLVKAENAINKHSDTIESLKKED